MGKKTKKEKRKADVHRLKSLATPMTHDEQETMPIAQSLHVYSFNTKSRSTKTIHAKSLEKDTTILRQDFLKTIILSIFAISIELILYVVRPWK